jgi:hypothetical protein
MASCVVGFNRYRTWFAAWLVPELHCSHCISIHPRTARGEGQSLLIGICYNVTSWFLPVRLQCGIHQHMERDVQNGSQHKYRLVLIQVFIHKLDASEGYSADAMAAPLRRVSSGQHQTLRRMPVTSGVPLRLHRDHAVVSLRSPDAPSDHIASSTHATPFNVSLLSPSLGYNLQPRVISRGRPLFPQMSAVTTLCLSLDVATRPVSTLQLHTTFPYERKSNAFRPNWMSFGGIFDKPVISCSVGWQSCVTWCYSRCGIPS